jgi:hypothetical protein
VAFSGSSLRNGEEMAGYGSVPYEYEEGNEGDAGVGGGGPGAELELVWEADVDGREVMSSVSVSDPEETSSSHESATALLFFLEFDLEEDEMVRSEKGSARLGLEDADPEAIGRSRRRRGLQR